MKFILTFLFVIVVCSVSSAQIPGMEDLSGIGGTEFPSDYPADMPKPKITMSLGSFPADNGKMFTFESDITVAEALKFFQDEMPKNGYEIIKEPVIIEKDKNVSAGWKKGNKEVTLAIKSDDENKKIAISILYQ